MVEEEEEKKRKKEEEEMEEEEMRAGILKQISPGYDVYKGKQQDRKYKQKDKHNGMETGHDGISM